MLKKSTFCVILCFLNVIYKNSLFVDYCKYIFDNTSALALMLTIYYHQLH